MHLFSSHFTTERLLSSRAPAPLKQKVLKLMFFPPDSNSLFMDVIAYAIFLNRDYSLKGQCATFAKKRQYFNNSFRVFVSRVLINK